MKNLRIAILDMNDGKPNQGLRCIIALVEQFLAHSEFDGTYDVFDVRQNDAVPRIQHYDIFLGSGGPGAPYPSGALWEGKFNEFLDRLYIHNQVTQRQKKFAFLICHSFQLACYHWRLGNVCPRRSTSFGVLPVHKTSNGMEERLFDDLPNPFYVVDSRDFQVIEPSSVALNKIGAKIMALEKKRPNVDLERAVMAIRFTDEIFGTQFHPEADAVGMHYHFAQDDKRQSIINKYGAQKYEMILSHLEDDDKISLTEKVIIPTFLQTSAKAIKDAYATA